LILRQNNATILPNSYHIQQINHEIKMDHTKEFKKLLNFHIDAQRGMFISKIVRFKDKAGVAVFSHSESDPSWNIFYVNDLTAALAQEKEIVTQFAVRGRHPVWYQPNDAPPLPSNWTPFGSDCWMVRCGAPELPATTPPFTLRQVDHSNPSDVAAFNSLYIDVFWDGHPDPGAATPINSEPSAAGNFTARHWLGDAPQGPVALISFLTRGDTAAIYNVGTPLATRGRGLGSAIMNYGMAAEAKLGIKKFFLITERDLPLEPFYRRLDFKTLTLGRYYRRDKA